MRILIDALGATSGGGGATRVLELGRTFPALRPESFFAFAVRPELADAVRARAPTATVVTPPARATEGARRLLWHHAGLPHVVAPLRLDAVFAPFNVLSLHWPGSRPALTVMVSNLSPYIVELQRMYPLRARPRLQILRWLSDQSVASADRIFLQAEHARQLVDPVSKYAHRIQVVPQALPVPPPADAAPRWRPARPYLIILSDLCRYKGIETALRALGHLDPALRPDLVVCGRELEPDYAHRLRSDAEAFGITEHVHFVGHLPHDEAMLLLRDARACIACSRFENQYRPPREAMAVGTPVLASDIPATRETCGDAAYYFAPDDAFHLGSLITEVVGSRESYAFLRARGELRISGLTTTSAAEVLLSALGHVVLARRSRENAR